MPEKTANRDLGRLDAASFRLAEKKPFAVVLEDVRSLNNVGSIFRTCDAFAARELVLCGLTGQPPHREIHKTALGAEETVSWRHFAKTEQAIESLRTEGYVIVAVEQAKPHVLLGEFEPEEGQLYAFLFGNEIYGIKSETLALSDFCVEIPQFGTKHSLNIAVSVGVVIWDFLKALIVKSKKIKPEVSPGQ